MALNYYLDAIQDHETVCWVGEGDDVIMNPVTNVLIWGTMFTGIGKITEENAGEFYARLKMHELLAGAMLTHTEVLHPAKRVHHDRFLTPEDVKRHVGLRTNVFPNKTRKQWERGLLNSKMDDWVAAYKANPATKKDT